MSAPVQLNMPVFKRHQIQILPFLSKSFALPCQGRNNSAHNKHIKQQQWATATHLEEIFFPRSQVQGHIPILSNRTAPTFSSCFPPPPLLPMCRPWGCTGTDVPTAAQRAPAPLRSAWKITQQGRGKGTVIWFSRRPRKQLCWNNTASRTWPEASPQIVSHGLGSRYKADQVSRHPVWDCWWLSASSPLLTTGSYLAWLTEKTVVWMHV